MNEEKGLILPDRPADTAAIAVVAQCGVRNVTGVPIPSIGV